MPTILQFRRGTTAQNDNYTGSVGELTVDTDLYVLRVHDGSTAGGNLALVGDTATQTLTNKTLTSPTLNSGVVGTALTLNAQAELRYADSDSSNYVGFKAPSTIAANVSWTLPDADASVSGYALVSDSAGTLSWAAAGATISQDESTDAGLQLYFASTTSGGLTAVKYDSGLTYNPSSGTLTAATINAATIGNSGAAITGSTLTGTLQTASQTNITGVGTLTSGTWNATTIGVAYGGTGVTSSTGSGSVVLSTSPTFTGTLTAATINAATIGNSGAAITGSTLTGTLQTAAQTNVTSLGTLTGLTLSGTLIGTTINAATIGNSGAAITGTLQTASQTNITGVGTLTSGTWNATTIATGYGGTGLTSFTNGGALYATSTSALTTGTLPVASGGTGVTSSTGSGSVVLSTSPTFSTKIITPVIEKSGTDGVGDIGQSGNKYATIYATTFSGTASTANYADLAEKYVADGHYEPGTVMVFGGEKEVTASLLSYETAIAGVISTAPAYLMNNELNEENTVSIALVGRVPCKVMGPVSKGTVLVTSEHAGVAMAIDNSKFLPGSIIGRAMEEHLELGVIKTIEVSVGRS